MSKNLPLKGQKSLRRSFSLIEIIVACAFMAIVARGLLVGWTRYQHTVAFDRAKEQIEHLLQQAHYLAMVSDQLVEVTFEIRDNGLQVSIVPWTVVPKDHKLALVHYSQKIKKVLQSQNRDDFLEIGSFVLNDDSSQDSLTFMGKAGLIDDNKRITAHKLVVNSRFNHSLSTTISLDTFHFADFPFVPFPEEHSHET